jgi:hypothetical protein
MTSIEFWYDKVRAMLVTHVMVPYSTLSFRHKRTKQKIVQVDGQSRLCVR